MEFKDRVSAYPGRYIMTTSDGSTSYVILERADEPTTPGTPLNAETFNAMQNDMVSAVQAGVTGYEKTDDGEYWKFADGTLVCSKRMSIQTNIKNSWGGMYEGSADLGNWPHTFTGEPTVIVTNMSAVGLLFEAWETPPTTTYCGTALFCRGTSLTMMSAAEVRVVGIGRWK